MAKEENIIYLFDESGRAILSPTDPHIFLGTGVLYNESSEDHLFKTCDELFCLSTKDPLKNTKISNELALTIAKKIVELKIPIICTWIDLNNENLITTIKSCIDLLVELKKYHHLRGSSRKKAHYLHDKILDKNIFDLLSLFLYNKNNVMFKINPFIDNWSIPKSEKKVSLKYRSVSIEKRIQEILNNFDKNILFKVEGIQLLENPEDKRKRFIDVIASTVSRAFTKVNETEYICKPSIVFPSNSTVCFCNYTKGIIGHTNKITNNLLKDDPVI